MDIGTFCKVLNVRLMHTKVEIYCSIKLALQKTPLSDRKRES